MILGILKRENFKNPVWQKILYGQAFYSKLEENALSESEKNKCLPYKNKINNKSYYCPQLHTLQLAHEKELMQMNMQLYPLQEEIKLLNRTVEILQERVRAADDKLLSYQCVERNNVDAGGDNKHFRTKESTQK